jgi:riboflavin synthase alpha subunit
VKKEMDLWDGSRAEGVELTVQSNECLKDAYIGCSIAVNGVCLTATSIQRDKVCVTNFASDLLWNRTDSPPIAA